MDYEMGGPGREGEEVAEASVLGQQAGQTSRRAAGRGAGREGSGLPVQGTDSAGHINHLPGAAFPKPEGAVCDQGLPLAS